MCSFCPRPTATSFSGIGRARTSFLLRRSRKKRVEEHRVPRPRDEPSTASPPQTARRLLLPRGDSRSPLRLCRPDPQPGALAASAGGPGYGGGSARPGQPPNRDPGPDTPKPGRSSKTQAGKGDIGGRIDLAPDMARCPCLARQPTIEEIREGDAHIQQEKAHPPMLRSCTMRLYEEKRNRGILASRARVRPRAAAR